MTAILKAWFLLIGASAATTGLAVAEAEGPWVAAVLLALALLKSRVILSDYLRLSQVPPIRRGFMAVLVVWSGIALALAFAAQS